MKKQEIIAAIAGSVLAASIFTGCVIGHAKFEGEDMHLYPSEGGRARARRKG